MKSLIRGVSVLIRDSGLTRSAINLRLRNPHCGLCNLVNEQTTQSFDSITYLLQRVPVPLDVVKFPQCCSPPLLFTFPAGRLLVRTLPDYAYLPPSPLHCTLSVPEDRASAVTNARSHFQIFLYLTNKMHSPQPVTWIPEYSNQDSS